MAVKQRKLANATNGRGLHHQKRKEWLRRDISGDQRAIEAQHTHKTPV
jgi:hypothetical protein